MTGTFINIAAVLFGGGLGLFFGARLPERVRQTVMAALGLFTLAFGARLFFDGEQPLIAAGSLLLGGALGEALRIEDGLTAVGSRLEGRVGGASQAASEGSRFVRGFVTASVLFCVGPMTILGSIQDGLTGDYELLAIKSMLDGFAALALASTLGVGVLFSILVVFVYQGGLSLLAAQAQMLLTDSMILEMTAVGGLIIMALGVSSLLQIKPIRTGNLLPALVIAPAVVWLLARFA